jgi:hypothetical protein
VTVGATVSDGLGDVLTAATLPAGNADAGHADGEIHDPTPPARRGPAVTGPARPDGDGPARPGPAVTARPGAPLPSCAMVSRCYRSG